MSVLKSRRTESKASYLNTANEIYENTLDFLTRLSARYSRLIASNIADIAFKLVTEVEIANSIYPSDYERIMQRRTHLLEALGLVNTLDVHLTHCYRILMKNPEGCFRNSKGETLKEYDAVRKLENMANTLGSQIDTEKGYLLNVMESDLKRKSNNKKDNTK